MISKCHKVHESIARNIGITAKLLFLELDAASAKHGYALKTLHCFGYVASRSRLNSDYVCESRATNLQPSTTDPS